MKPLFRIFRFYVLQSLVQCFLIVQLTKLFKGKVVPLLLNIKEFLTFFTPIVVVGFFHWNSLVSKILKSTSGILNLKITMKKKFEGLLRKPPDFKLIFNHNWLSDKSSGRFVGEKFQFNRIVI